MIRELSNDILECMSYFYTPAEIERLLSGIPSDETAQLAIDAVNAVAPAGWGLVVEDGKVRWCFDESIVKEDVRNGRRLGAPALFCEPFTTHELALIEDYLTTALNNVRAELIEACDEQDRINAEEEASLLDDLIVRVARYRRDRVE